MILLALLLAGAAPPPPTLILEKVRTVEDPRAFNFRDDVNGDRGVPMSCASSDGTTVTLSKGQDASLEVRRGTTSKRVVVEDVRGLGRSTLACGDADGFYYANPRHGRVYAYSADRLFEGKDPLRWSHAVTPFTSIDEAGGDMAGTSVATVLLMRQHLLMVEWFYRREGTTEFWHEVLEPATGSSLGKLGPSDLLAKANDRDAWWILFEGGGNETVNYVPRSLYRLEYGVPAAGDASADRVLEGLRRQPRPRRLGSLTKLSGNPVVNHMIALLTPTRTTTEPRIDLCPIVPADRARYWLGADYEPEIAELARGILLRFSIDQQASAAGGNPLDAWFQAAVAPTEPMKTLLSHFDPQDDRWVAAYERALLSIAGPTLDGLFAKYGVDSGVVVRQPSTGD